MQINFKDLLGHANALDRRIQEVKARLERLQLETERALAELSAIAKDAKAWFDETPDPLSPATPAVTLASNPLMAPESAPSPALAPVLAPEPTRSPPVSVTPELAPIPALPELSTLSDEELGRLYTEGKIDTEAYNAAITARQPKVS